MAPNSGEEFNGANPIQNTSKLFCVAEIQPWLYLSGASILGARLLEDLGITCVVSACPELPFLPLPKCVKHHHRLNIRDLPTADIRTYLSDVADIITQVQEEGGKTLVHCVAGVSRSASLCIGYLIKARGATLEDAYNHVLSCRPCIRPNNGFFEQLIQFEEDITGSTTVEMVYNEGAKSLIPNVYESDYINTLRYINRAVGIK